MLQLICKCSSRSSKILWIVFNRQLSFYRLSYLAFTCFLISQITRPKFLSAIISLVNETEIATEFAFYAQIHISPHSSKMVGDRDKCFGGGGVTCQATCELPFDAIAAVQWVNDKTCRSTSLWCTRATEIAPTKQNSVLFLDFIML